MKVECIDKEFDITIGKIYEVIMLKNQGEIYQQKMIQELLVIIQPVVLKQQR